MPLPAYIMCSQSGAIDQNTGLISFFSAIEVIQISKLAPGSPPPSLVAGSNVFWLVASWVREQSDTENQEFEVDIIGIFPPNQQEFQLGQAKFRFTTLMHRIYISQFALNLFFGPGVLRIEARIRRAGETLVLNRMAYHVVLQEAIAPQVPSNIPVNGNSP
jgi:hypothetical protein